MRDFENDLYEGQKGEELFEKSRFIQEVLWTNKFKRLYGDDQKYKGDFEVKGIYLEIKTLSSTYKPEYIPIELFHMKDNKQMDGWINKYSDKTFMVFQWLNKEKNELVNFQICFPLYKLRKHTDYLNKLKIESSKNPTYTTHFVLLSIQELINKCNPLIRYLK